MVKPQTAFALVEESSGISESQIAMGQTTALSTILFPCRSRFTSYSSLPTQDEPLNSREQRAVEALIAWVSYTQEVREETISAILAAQFKCDDIRAIQSALYNEIIKFMLVVKIVDVLN